MVGKGAWRDLVVSLSIANLWFLKLWLKILPYNDSNNMLVPFSPLNTYIAAMLNVAAWGTLLFLLVRLCRERVRLFPWLVLAVFFATCVIAAYGVGASFISLAKFVFLFGARSATLLYAALCLVSLAASFLLVRYRRRLAAHYAVLPLLFSPYLLVTFSQSLTGIAKVEPSAHFGPHALWPARPLENPFGPRRVVWIIFDETDYRLGFEKRPSSLSLPAFDRFKESALFATQAYSPNDNTQTSLPALISGIPLKETSGRGANGIDLVHAGTLTRSDFTAADTVFREVKARGGSSALFGWFLPYGRVMKDVDLCADYPRYNYYTSDSLLDVFIHQPGEVLDMRFLPFKNTLLAKNQIDIVTRMRADVADAVKNDDASLMFLHYSVPHSPNVYNRRTGGLGFNRSKREGYFDNLALADRCLAELRKEMEAKGTWDSALVIVSSDHHWRTNTYDQVLDRQHVPYLVKFPHQNRSVAYRGKFNTILTKELVLAFFDRKVDTPEDAERFFDSAMRTSKTPVVISAEQPDAD